MSSNRIIGMVLLVVGVALLIIGLNASDSVADQVKETFTGRFTDKTTWYIVGGIGLGVIGMLVALFGGGRGARA